MSIVRRLRCWRKARALVLALDQWLPADAHERCGGRLGVSVTTLWPVENRFVSEFATRQELIEAVAAGCYIPIWSGSVTFPKFRGHSCVDGAYTDNRPKFKLRKSRRDERCRRQVELSPFAGLIEVSPQCSYSGNGNHPGRLMMRILGTMYYMTWDTFLRSCHAIMPMSVASYRPYLYEGHRDMKDFVLRNELIKCSRCYEQGAQSSSECCVHCLRLLERVDSLEVPEELARLCE